MKYHVTFYDDVDRSPFPEFSDKDTRVSKMEDAQVLVSVGGDGTFLKMFQNAIRCFDAAWFKRYYLGINLGHVGFLTNDRSIVGEYLVNLISNHLLFRYPLVLIDNHDQRSYALNEIVIRSTTGQLLTVNVQIKGTDAVYKGDGLIIASSTGSTAYNLSAGGPILDPGLANMILTPICSFTLSNRSVVLDEKTHITVKVDDVDANVFVDGQLLYTQGPFEFEVKLSETCMQTVYKDSFVEAIQKKLGWNNNIR